MCRLCHSCGNPIRTVLDGEEWCSSCQAYQRPLSHGWGRLPDQTADELRSCEQVKARFRPAAPALRPNGSAPAFQPHPERK